MSISFLRNTGSVLLKSPSMQSSTRNSKVIIHISRCPASCVCSHIPTMSSRNVGHFWGYCLSAILQTVTASFVLRPLLCATIVLLPRSPVMFVLMCIWFSSLMLFHQVFIQSFKMLRASCLMYSLCSGVSWERMWIITTMHCSWPFKLSRAASASILSAIGVIEFKDAFRAPRTCG